MEAETEEGADEAPPGDAASQAGDCDDDDPEINPDAFDECDGRDNNCDGEADELDGDLDGDGLSDCIDPDGDGDGDPNTSDCEPFDADVSSLSPEVCDGLDNNCNLLVDEGFWNNTLVLW